MSSAELIDGDGPILDQIRVLVSSLSDGPTRTSLQTAIDAVALNPQPLPPEGTPTTDPGLDAVALSPQPLPPGQAE